MASAGRRRPAGQSGSRPLPAGLLRPDRARWLSVLAGAVVDDVEARRYGRSASAGWRIRACDPGWVGALLRVQGRHGAIEVKPSTLAADAGGADRPLGGLPLSDHLQELEWLRVVGN